MLSNLGISSHLVQFQTLDEEGTRRTEITLQAEGDAHCLQQSLLWLVDWIREAQAWLLVGARERQRMLFPLFYTRAVQLADEEENDFCGHCGIVCRRAP
jgi:hypothetical protein